MKVNKVNRAIIAAFAAVFAIVAPAVAADIVLPNGIDTSSYQENNTVYDGTTYYPTLQKAVEGVCGNDGAILYCKPGADVGSLQHAPVTATLTIYGNGASVSGGSERDFDIGNTDPNGGRDITADMTLTVKDLEGCGAWGNKATAHTVNLVFEDCQNMGKVFITGTTGTLNITIKDSSFEGVIKEAVYSNADGAITLNNVDFSNLTKAVNLNHKAAGTQTVTITDCTFTNCGSDVSNDEIPVRVLSSVDGGKSVLTVSGTTFTGTPEGGADILLPENVGVTEVAISTTITSVSHKGEMISVKEDESYSNQAPAVAKIGDVEFTNFADALAAAKAMTGSVTVKILEKVTLNSTLSGSYTSIKFVGEGENAEIYLDVQGYIEAPGKNVAFENLNLSKSVGGFIGNAGFMNVAFGVYNVAAVTYTNCTFLNGAYASSGAVTFAGCTFKRSHDKYGLWAYGNANITVDGCTFADYRGIKMYAENGADASVVKPALTVKNTNFSAVDDKPAIVLTYGQSVTLENNTYSSNKGVFELDLDGKPNGVTVTFDVAPTCVNDNGACGVLVDGKIYTTVAQAAEVATASSTVTLLHNSAETVELPEGVTLNRNGFTADGVTVKQSAKNIEVTDANGNVTYYAGFTGFSDLDLADCTIKLLNNVSDANLILNKGSTSKIVDTNVTLDLNGYTFSRTGSSSGAINLTNGAGLTIRDSSDAKTGKILVDTYAIWMMNGDFVLESGTIETTSTKNAAIYANAAKVDIKAGKIISAGNAITVGENFMESRGASTIAISGGEIVAAGVGIKNGSYAQDSTAVTVTGGKIDSEGDSINMEKGSAQVSGGTFSSDVFDYCVDGYESKQNADGTYGVVANPAYGKVAQIGDNYYATLADALSAAKDAGMTDVVITLVGETNANSPEVFYLYGETVFNSVTFKQADPTKQYFIKELYTGRRVNNGEFIFDGVNITITGSGCQYIFEGNVKLINNSTITSRADANCFVYYANVTIEPGSKLNGVIDDIRGGTLTVDGGKTDGTVNSTPDLQDAFLHVNWADSKLVVKNGAYVKINSVNEIGKLTVNGTVEVLNAKLEVLQEIAISQNASMKADAGSEINAGKITGAGKIVVDAAGMSAGDEISLTANLANFTGTLETVGNDDLEASIVDGKIVLSAKPVAKIGDTTYATLEDAFKAATEGCTIEILSDVTIDYKWDCRDYVAAGSHSQFKESVTINGNGHTLKFTGTVSDGNWMTIFRFEENATINNLTVDISEATGAQRVISAKKSLTVDGLTIVGSARYGIIFGEGASATDLAATEIVVKNSTLTGTRRAISDNESGKDVKSVVITGNTLSANAYASAFESITFNNNTAAGEVDLRSYTAETVLSVEAKDNTLTEGVKNYIYAKTIDAQDEFTVARPVIMVAKVNELSYATLADALAAAHAGDTVELLSNVVVGSYETNKFENVNFTAVNGAEMTIEANGEVQFIGSDLTNVKIIGAGTTRFYNTVNFYGVNNVLSAINGTPFDLIVNKQSTLFISRFVLGYNRNITVYGDIEDASDLTASDITGMTPSLKFNSTSGVSVGGTDVGNLIVKDAYIELGNSSWKNAYGTYDWNFTNSYVSATSLFNAAAGGTSAAKWNVTFDDCVLSAKNYIKNGVGVTINFYNGSVATTGSMRIDGELNIDKTSSVLTTLQQNNVVGKVDEHGGINGTVNVEGVLTIGSNARTQLEVLGGKINIKGGTLNLGNNTLTLDSASEMTSSGDVTGAIVVADGALVSLTGGTYTQDVKDWCAEGYLCAEQNSDPVTYKVGKLPSAEVVNLGPVEVGPDGDYTFGDNYYVYDLVGTQKMTTSSDPFDLQIALNFIAKDTVAQAEKNAFGNYTTDFYITIDGIKDGSFVADENCYLAGYYPSFNAWVKIPLAGFKIEDRKVYPVITSAGFDFKYTDICGSVGDFICGIHLSDAVLQANPDLKVKLELGLSKTYDDALAADKFVGVDQPYEYDVEDMTSAVAVTGPDYYTTVEGAIAVALETGDFVKLVKDSKLEENLTLAKNLNFNLGGNTLSANGKSLAIGNTYVAITNGTLAGFTSANITLTGNAVLTVTDKNVADSFRTSAGHYVSQNANGTYSIMLKSAFRVFITMVDGESRIGFFKDFATGSVELKLVAVTNLEKPDWQAVAYVKADDSAGASTLPLYWVKLNQAADDANVYRFFKITE